MTEQTTSRNPRNQAMPAEERRRRNTEIKRNAYRRKHGIPLDAPIGFIRPKAPTKPKNLDNERARRSAEVYAAQLAGHAPAPKPVCHDPPELQELFRKASKGEPPRPIPIGVRKRSVFDLRFT